jgi:hypothetical protein
LRWPEDHAFFVESFGPRFFHIHIDAPADLRRARYSAENEDAFEVASNHVVEHQVPALRALAHFNIPNTGSRDDFTHNVGSLLPLIETTRNEN